MVLAQRSPLVAQETAVEHRCPSLSPNGCRSGDYLQQLKGGGDGMIHGENLGEPRGSSYLGGLASEAAKPEAGDVGHLKTVGRPEEDHF